MNYIEQISLFYFPQQFLILLLRVVKILAGLLVHLNILIINTFFPKSKKLTFFVLICAGYTHIAVYFHISSSCKFLKIAKGVSA